MGQDTGAVVEGSMFKSLNARRWLGGIATFIATLFWALSVERLVFDSWPTWLLATVAAGFTLMALLTNIWPFVLRYMREGQWPRGAFAQAHAGALEDLRAFFGPFVSLRFIIWLTYMAIIAFCGLLLLSWVSGRPLVEGWPSW